MKTITSSALTVVLTVLASTLCGQTLLSNGLQVTYDSGGVQQISFNGVQLENANTFPTDRFHIWHMKATDLSGKILSGDQYGWGEVNSGRVWDAATHTWTYSFRWGFIRVQFAQSGNTLDMTVTTHNNADSGIIFDGAVIYPFVLRFPKLPAGFTDPSYEQLAFNTTGPSVTTADFGSGEVLSVLTDSTKPLYTGFEPAGGPNAYFPIVASTSLDGLATFYPRLDRPVQPGATDTYTVSLRFAPSGTPSADLATDAYANWAATWPAKLNWPDRRIIGTVFLASAADGNPAVPAGYANNPRRYFNNGNAGDFDVRTPDGLARFQARVLQQAESNVDNLKRLNAQGAITWDIEGQQYPHSTSYVCSPDQIAQLSPEMETTVADASSPYFGRKLDDAYFQIIRNGGFRVGVCIRPQQFILNPDGTAGQVTLPSDQVASQLIRKIRYAHDRWAASIFYVDSSVDPNGAALDPSIFQQVAAEFPDSLVIPEETSPKYYAYTAPFQSFIFHTDLGTPADVYAYYPNAFSCNLVNDVDAAKLAQFRPQLTDSVRRGDVLMVHADYWQENNGTVVQIYNEARGLAPTQPVDLGPPPAPTVPVVPPPSAPTPPAPVLDSTPSTPLTPSTGPVTIQFPTDGQIVSGTITVVAQIAGTLDSAGSYLIVDGRALDGHRVPNGPYAYTLDTASLSGGTHTIQVWAHDIGNNTLLSQPIAITVGSSAAEAVTIPH